LKTALISNISTDTKYFFTNEKTKLYKVLFIKAEADQGNDRFTLTVIPDVPFQVSPLEFEKIEVLTLGKAVHKEELYQQLENFIEQSFSSGYSRVYLEANHYNDEEEKYISDVTAGVPCLDYEPDDAKIFHMVETSQTTSLRYDVYETAIKVSKDSFEKNSFIYEEFYTLWYPDLEATEKAMQSILDSRETSTYTFDEFSNKAREYENHEQIYLNPESIIFDHLIKPESYLSDQVSGLLLPIPQSEFAGFDASDIEEGRIYFWIRKNKNKILNSELHYFVLQDRQLDGHIIGSSKLKEFSKSYWEEDFLSMDSMSDEIQHLMDRVSGDYEEIPQEEIIEILTGLKASDVLTQTIQKTIYLQAHTLDIYENMIQLWVEGNEKHHFANRTFFSANRSSLIGRKTEIEKFLGKEIAKQKHNGFNESSKSGSENLLKHYRSIQETNAKYKNQKIIKERLLERHPDIKDKLDDYEYEVFMKYSPLKIIEGDYAVAHSLEFDANETSFFIEGDLIIDGTLTVKPAELFQSKNFLIVSGDVSVNNFVQSPMFSFVLFAQDFSVTNIMYLPAASRSWFINIAGTLEADILIHSKDKKIKGVDKKIIFNHEYSTTNKKLFVDGFFNEHDREQPAFIYNRLVEGKSLLRDNLNQIQVDNDLFLTAFKNHLRNWREMYYQFAGFELQELEPGEHYGFYIESDEIVRDVRHDTGMYLMSHDDFSLELVEAAQPLKEERVSSSKLAYRFFWIMWTFSTWRHREDGPLDYWQSIDNIDSAYLNDKPHFEQDIHLALYWLMHFGLLEDERYEEIQEIMHGSEHALIKGALIFFAELNEDQPFAINIEREQNTELFKSRIKLHKEQIKKALVPEDDLLAYTLSQFSQQPERVLDFIEELYSSDQWDEIGECLNTTPYQPGFSYLYAITATQVDKSKWHKLFLKEVQTQKDIWQNKHYLVPMLEKIYQDFDYGSLNRAMSIMLDDTSSSSWAGVYTKMQVRLGELTKPQEMNEIYVDSLEGLTKHNFDFQTFLNSMVSIETERKIDFIRLCIEKDLFNDTIINKSTTPPYLLVWYLADKDFYPVKKAKRKQEISEVITHYKLSTADFEEKYRQADLSEDEMLAFFEPIKGYF